MAGVRCNLRVVLCPECVNASRRLRQKERKVSRNAPTHGGITRTARAPKQEIISGERDACGEQEDNELRWHSERANEAAAAVEEENDRDVDSDEANNARHEWRETQPTRRGV